MLKLNKQELEQWKHIIEHQRDINKQCESQNNEKMVCCLLHTKLVRNCLGEIKEIVYKCERQQQQLKFKNIIIFESNLKLEKDFLKWNGLKFDNHNKITNSIENTKKVFGLIKDKTFNKEPKNSFGYIDIPFWFCNKLIPKLNDKELDNTLINQIVNIDILFLDNLGAEPKNRFLFENYIVEILRQRQQLNKKTYLLIENDYEKIYQYEKQYEKTLIDRFKKYCL